MNRNDLRLLTEMRLREAQALLESGNPCGAYYLAGFAFECGLKDCIARKTIGLMRLSHRGFEAWVKTHVW